MRYTLVALRYIVNGIVALLLVLLLFALESNVESASDCDSVRRNVYAGVSQAWCAVVSSKYAGPD